MAVIEQQSLTGSSIHKILPKVSLWLPAHSLIFQTPSHKESDCCNCGKWAVHSIHTSCPFIRFLLLITYPDPETVWWNQVMKTNYPRLKQGTLQVLLDNESFLSPDPDSE
ncbi:hypothetical protein AVEN_61792-1 [Araneus ventricosus]|uniref:Uncharacterized protein n=1 Tax=Araneus ventricosus TaxID=182803 RepID=A0A4Y2PZB7_ARAVE|nr:hypothetical protein AVEN_61792-1 [Araneus ventricosus]